MPVITQITTLAKKNKDFRELLHTTDHTQVVLMSIAPGDDIGEETHDGDQIIFFVEGKAQLILDSKKETAGPSDLLIIPAGTKHNVINTGTTELKLFTIYAPPEHVE